MLAIPAWMFVYTPDVSGNLRREAAKNPELAQIAGLDFPAHGAE